MPSRGVNQSVRMLARFERKTGRRGGFFQFARGAIFLKTIPDQRIGRFGLVAKIDVIEDAAAKRPPPHDPIEDTETSVVDTTDRFGERVTNHVLEVTDDGALPKVERERMQILNAPPRDALLMKLHGD